MTINPPCIDKLKYKASYRQLLGDVAWSNLHEDVKGRFSEAYDLQAHRYTGIMSEVYLSVFGSIFAHLCRLIGTPLALYNGRNIPIDVDVYLDSDEKSNKGVVWDRQYYYPKKGLNRVRSSKIIDSGNQLIEVVGAGFGMELVLSEERGALVFTSKRFFWEIFGVRIYMPDALSPGKTKVMHRAMYDQYFEFSLTVEHPIFGLMYRQLGIFRES